MSITMRVIQRYDIRRDAEFHELERKFAELERSRADYRRGRRFRPISGPEPVNTLIWEGEFENLAEARAWLEFLDADSDHGALFARQLPMFRDVRVEYYENLEY